MSRLKLYLAPGTCALAVHIALHEADAGHELALVNFAASQQRSPEYLAVNPKGRVPALVTEQGVLTETPALLLYVAQLFPAAQLAPLDDLFALARMQECNNYLASTVHINHAHRPRASRWADEPEAIAGMQRKVAQNMTENFRYLEQTYLQNGPWVLGERYSVADGYLYTVGDWLASDGVDIRDFPAVYAHRERVLQRPAVQRALATAQLPKAS
ncbi:glutathione S-transferase N-terminal domain-containing protein [Curvibacter sp. HBC61]|uniref:Glutathione S-transferase N-terminal domain-containing protein n=1 Tax=Curvibacter cyanobacteriorum TaxID=3026422 RepID=A0ABT5N3Y5_9BURK|nr:glutathione S-transferase N-terminal domain-containing protein [Curvibacter sp. HBC61]MDD0840356.1 glutathione S-transferase N-terminal domain-containing protein [Curvibacter sp. HBC61]